MELSQKGQNVCRQICLFLYMIGFLCYLVAFVLPYWMYTQYNGYIVWYGIFATCLVTSKSTYCGTLSIGARDDGLFISAQIFGILTLLTYFVATITCGMAIFWPFPWKRYLMYFSGGSAVVTVVFGSLLIALYGGYHSDVMELLQVGFYMATASVCFILLVGIFAFIIANLTTKPPKVPDDVITEEETPDANDWYLDPIFRQSTPQCAPMETRAVDRNSRTTKHGSAVHGSGRRTKQARLEFDADISHVFINTGV